MLSTTTAALPAASSFAELGLRPELLRALETTGYQTPTPVQAEAIPVVLSGRDILAGAQTGTGKTAAFALPLLQRLIAQTEQNRVVSGSRRPIRALVLTPTRELAAQVRESIREYGAHLPLASAVMFGGVGMAPQIEALRRGIDILVATPGRLLDHVSQRTVDLSRVEFFVLDEADRMLDMGFIRDIKRVIALLPGERQNLLFSATYSDDIRQLASGLLRDPAYVQIGQRNAQSELVTQAVYLAPKEQKRALLSHLIASAELKQALVFTRTKHGADRLAKQLRRDGIEAVPIHGDRTQGQRTKALADFKAGTARVLVATDIAARGLDIDQLPHVFNYELPNVPEDYVHRIGRTGRAGSPGEAISLVAPDEQAYLSDIEKLLKKRIERRQPSGFDVAAAVAQAQAADARAHTQALAQAGPNGFVPRADRGGNRPQRSTSGPTASVKTANGRPPLMRGERSVRGERQGRDERWPQR